MTRMPKPSRIVIGNPKASPFRESVVKGFPAGPTGPVPTGGEGEDPPLPYVLVAANSASSLLKSIADFVCDGTDDQVEILAAQSAAATNGQYLQFTAGQFNLNLAAQLSPSVPWRGWSSAAASEYDTVSTSTTFNITPTANLTQVIFQTTSTIERIRFRLLTAAFDITYFIRSDAGYLYDCGFWQQSDMIDTAFARVFAGDESQTTIFRNLRFDHNFGGWSPVPAILIENFQGADISHIKVVRFDAPAVVIASGTARSMVSNIQHLFGSTGTPSFAYVVLDNGPGLNRINCQSILTDQPGSVGESNNCAT